MNESEKLKTLAELKTLAPDLIRAAQEVYDSWEKDEHGNVWCGSQEGGGGICHLIADAILDVLASHGFECGSQSWDMSYGPHVSALVKIEEGVYNVDINPFTYEKGGGYSYEKIPDIKFEVEDLDVYKVSSDPEDFENYMEG